MRNTEDRYRSLLDASSFADQPTLKAVLHSLRNILSSTSKLHGTELSVLNNAPEITCAYSSSIGNRKHTALEVGSPDVADRHNETALDEQKPVFIPEVSQEMLKLWTWLSITAEVAGRTAFYFQFPLPTSNTDFSP